MSAVVEGVGVGQLEDGQVAVGMPSTLLLMSWFLAPSSTRPTSLIRTIRPVGRGLDDDVLELLRLDQAGPACSG